MVFQQVGDFGDRLLHTRLIVRLHDRNKQRVGSQRFLEVVGIHPPAAATLDQGHFKAPALQFLHRLKHRLVLDPRADQMLPSRLLTMRCQP